MLKGIRKIAVVAILILISSIALSACTKTPTPKPNPDPSPEQSQEQKPSTDPEEETDPNTPPPSTDLFTVAFMNCRVMELGNNIFNTGSMDGPLNIVVAQGNSLVQIGITITNTSTAPLALSQASFRLQVGVESFSLINKDFAYFDRLVPMNTIPESIAPQETIKFCEYTFIVQRVDPFDINGGLIDYVDGYNESLFFELPTETAEQGVAYLHITIGGVSKELTLNYSME